MLRGLNQLAGLWAAGKPLVLSPFNPCRVFGEGSAGTDPGRSGCIPVRSETPPQLQPGQWCWGCRRGLTESPRG